MSSGQLPEHLREAIGRLSKEDVETVVVDLNLRVEDLLRKGQKKGTPDEQTG